MNSLLNTIRLNSVSLNLVGMITRKRGGTSNVPEGYEAFLAADGEFLAADGEFFVRINS